MTPVFDRCPVLVGHRGMGRGQVGEHYENTLGSFLAAAAAGLRWVEVDVRRTGDDVLVVAHETVDPQGRFFTDLDAAAAGDSALMLQDLLDALPAGVGVDLDVKSSMEDARRERPMTTAALLAPVARREMDRRPVLVSSFDPSVVAVLSEREPGVPRGLLTWIDFPIGIAVAAAAHLAVRVLGAHVGSLRPTGVERGPRDHSLGYTLETVHAAGMQLLAWCPGPDAIDALVRAGADALCVDDVPDVLARRPAGAGTGRAAGVGMRAQSRNTRSTTRAAALPSSSPQNRSANSS